MTNGKAVSTLQRLNPQLVSIFCRGTPATLRSNIKPELGLAHGSSVELYSLEWSTPELTEAALQYLSDNPGDVHLPDDLRPSAVLVRVLMSPAQRSEWLRVRPHLSRVTDDIVIPVDNKPEYVNLVSIVGAKLLAATIMMPQYDLDLIGTVHKCQGKTLLRSIISLLRRFGNPIREDYHALYVALGRVREGKYFRVLAERGDLGFVNNLRPPHELLAFLDGYDEHGVWDRKRALASLETRKAASPIVVTQRKRASSAPAPAAPSDSVTTKRQRQKKA
jgi:hypothetical protein